MKPQESAALLVRNRYGSYLMSRRGPRLTLTGFLQPPGGKLAKGEKPKAAAAREGYEETGVKFKINALAWVGTIGFATPSDSNFLVHGFLYQYNGTSAEFHDRENNGIVWRWVAPGGMVQPMLRCVLPLVELAEEYLEKKKGKKCSTISTTR